MADYLQDAAMTTDFIDDRLVLATIPKAPDVDTRISVVHVADARVLEVQDVTRSTGFVGRGWYCALTDAGLNCLQEVAAVMATFSAENEL